MDLQKLGNQIREAREAAGMTQQELAEKTGTARSNISRLEAGRQSPSYETLSKIAQALGKELVLNFK